MAFGGVGVMVRNGTSLMRLEDTGLENFALTSSLGCCCGAEDVEAPTEQSVCKRVTVQAFQASRLPRKPTPVRVG